MEKPYDPLFCSSRIQYCILYIYSLMHTKQDIVYAETGEVLTSFKDAQGINPIKVLVDKWTWDPTYCGPQQGE